MLRCLIDASLDKMVLRHYYYTKCNFTIKFRITDNFTLIVLFNLLQLMSN